MMNAHSDTVARPTFSYQTSPRLSHLFVLRIDVFARKCDAIILRLFLFCDQQVVFCFQQVGAVVDGDLEIVAVRDRVLRARLDAETAKDAAAVIDVVNLGVPLVAADRSSYGRGSSSASM